MTIRRLTRYPAEEIYIDRDGNIYAVGDSPSITVPPKNEEIRPKRVVWVNLYDGEDGAGCWETKEQADYAANCIKRAGIKRLACQRVEIEIGRFDD